MTDYITLKSSTGGIDKRFEAESMGRTAKRVQTVSELTGGKLSIASGRARDHYAYVLMVPHTPTDLNYGSLDDLRQLWRLNNPNGSPSDVLTLVKYDGTELEVRALGDLPERPFSVIVEDEGAYYLIEVEFVDVTRQRFELDTPAGSMFLPLI